MEDSLGFFQKGVRNASGGLKNFTVTDSFDEQLNPELFTSEARQALSQPVEENEKLKNLLIHRHWVDGGISLIRVELSKEFFAPKIGMYGINGNQVYSVLRYLMQKQVSEITVHRLMVEFLEELNEYHFKQGTNLSVNDRIDFELRINERD